MRQIKKDRGYAMIYLDSLQELEKEDINACLTFASKLMDRNYILKSVL